MVGTVCFEFCFDLTRPRHRHCLAGFSKDLFSSSDSEHTLQQAFWSIVCFAGNLRAVRSFGRIAMRGCFAEAVALTAYVFRLLAFRI